MGSEELEAEKIRITHKMRKQTLRKRVGRWLASRSARERYEERWSPEHALQRLDLSSGEATPIQWGERHYWANDMGIKRVHLACLAQILEAQKPASVLEIGCGMGQNLFILAAMFPEFAFTGIELTHAGVDAARSLQDTRLDPALAAYAPGPVRDPDAHQRVTLYQGTAAALPFPADSFDLVYSMQAVEQMHLIRRKALHAIARVARGPVVFFEPFADFNTTPDRQERVRRLGLFRLPAGELPRYGLEHCTTFADLPMKLNYGVGLVLANAGKA